MTRTAVHHEIGCAGTSAQAASLGRFAGRRAISISEVTRQLAGETSTVEDVIIVGP